MAKGEGENIFEKVILKENLTAVPMVEARKALYLTQSRERGLKEKKREISHFSLSKLIKNSTIGKNAKNTSKPSFYRK